MMIAAEFAPDSSEAAAAMRCAHEHVIIPGYGRVVLAEDCILNGVGTVTAYFADETPAITPTR